MKIHFYITCFLIFCFQQASFAQNSPITVKDYKTKEALVGATIIHGEGGYITDIDGKFTILNPTFPFDIVVSYIGYVSQEIRVGNVSNMNFVLKEMMEVLSLIYLLQER